MSVNKTRVKSNGMDEFSKIFYPDNKVSGENEKLNEATKQLTGAGLDKIVTTHGNVFEYAFDPANVEFIDGTRNFQATAFLILAWHALCKLHGETTFGMSVVFEDVQCLGRKTFKMEKIYVTVSKISGRFEIMNQYGVLATGKVNKAGGVEKLKLKLPTLYRESKLSMTIEEIYKELTLRGYDISESNKPILESDANVKIGKMLWTGDWVTFLDSVLQFDILGKCTREVYTPQSITGLSIDCDQHNVTTLTNEEVKISKYAERKIVNAGGVTVNDIKWSEKIPENNSKVIIEKYAYNKHGEIVKLEDIIYKTKNARAVVNKPGDLFTIQWVQSPCYVPSEDQEICHVYSVGLNYEDLLCAMGRKAAMLNGDSSERTLGTEFSGITSTGRRVIGIVPTGALASTVLADKTLLWEIPSHWTMDYAASVPTAFFTAYYALLVRAKLKPRSTVVVYCGTSFTSIAAINLALHHKCKVFTTCSGDSGQKEFIRSRFFQLSKEQIGVNWDPNFEQNVLEATGGKGADLILNPLGPKKLASAVKCLASGGQILDIINGLDDELVNMQLPMKNNQSYHAIDIMTISREEVIIASKLMTEGLKLGHVYPSYLENYTARHIERALRSTSLEKQLGKRTVTVRKEDKMKKSVNDEVILAVKRIYMDSDKAYVIIGSHGLVTELGQWLVTRGAQKLILLNDQAITGYTLMWIKRWERKGIKVSTYAKQQFPEGIDSFLEEVSAVDTIGGIFDISLLSYDVIADANTLKEGINKLDAAIRKKITDLDHCVVFSTNNTTFLTNLAKGFSGVLVQIGSSEQHQTNVERKNMLKTMHQAVKGLLESMDTILSRSHSLVSLVPKFY